MECTRTITRMCAHTHMRTDVNTRICTHVHTYIDIHSHIPTHCLVHELTTIPTREKVYTQTRAIGHAHELHASIIARKHMRIYLRLGGFYARPWAH